METDYKVLYRKYRPSNFDEIVGQKYVVNMLKNAIINDKLSHAYIFTGPRGTGKTSTAKIFAKTINCEETTNGIPCGKCQSCLNFKNNADIIEIDAASNNGVDEIRELINNVKIAPSFCKYKVYIIDEVHMLSQSAFNALLLTLEEPPAHIIFILATTNVENVPITILSRCQRYDFKKIEDAAISEHLSMISKKENIEIEKDAIEEITYLSDGGLRDALSILNQLSTSSNHITLDTVLENYGSVSLVQIKNIIQSFFSNDYKQLKKIFENLTNGAIDYKTFIKKLIDELFLNAISMKSNGKNADYLKCKKVVFELNDLINKINITIDPFLLIFMIFVENIDEIPVENDSATSVSELSASDQNLNKEMNSSDSLESSENSRETDFLEFLTSLIPIRINNCFTKADKSYLLIAKKNWKKFVENISSCDSFKNLLIDSDVVLASPDIYLLVHSQRSVVEMINNEIFSIEKKFKELYNSDIKFIALSLDMWNTEKTEYVKKLKNGDVYQFIEEPTFQNEEKQNIEASPEEETDIMAIFDKDKVVIQ